MSRRIAILMATYNGEEFLREQIDSILNQTYSEDFIIAIHDDGSVDGTVSIIKEYAESFPGIIRVIDGSPAGSAKRNFWYLLGSVEADVYFFCDQDDVWLPDKVKCCVERLLSIPQDVRCVFSDMKVVDRSLDVIDDSFLHFNGRDPGVLDTGRILIDNPAAGASMCFDRALRDIALSVDFDIDKVEMHDGFLLAMASLCGKVEYIDRSLVLYRQHDTNDMGAAQSESLLQRIIRNIKTLFTGAFFSDKQKFLSLSQNAAGELSRIESLKADDRAVIEAYANITDMSRYRRILFMKDNCFNRAKNTWWLYIMVFLQK